MHLLRKLIINKVDTPNKTSMYLLGLFSFTLPLYQKISTIILLLLIMVSIIKFIVDKEFSPLLAYLFPVSLYVLIVISIFITQNFEIKYLEQRAALIGLPIIFLTLNISQNAFKKLLQYFIYGCLVALIICYINAFKNSFIYIDNKWLFQPVVNREFSFFYSVVRDGNYFFSSFFSILHDSTYMAIYFNFAIIIILAFSLWKKSKIYYILLFFFTLAIFQLSSKISIVTMFLIYSGYLFNNIKKASLKWVCISLTLLLGCIFLFQNPRGRVMVQKFNEEGMKFSPNERFGYALRLMSWEAALELIQEHPVLGVGVNNTQKELDKKYENKGYTTPKDNSFNAHNQFFQTFLETGLLGALLILSMQFILFKIAFLNKMREHSFLIMMFFVVVTLSFLFESMFNRYSGLAFFMFFYCMIVNNNSQTKAI